MPFFDRRSLVHTMHMLQCGTSKPRIPSHSCSTHFGEESPKIWHRPNTFQSQHLFLETFCHFWFEIHCCKYDNKAWFTTSLSRLYNYRFGFQTFKASLILDARCARGSHELPYFDASFICTQPGLKQQTFSRRETENLPKGLKE